MMNFFFINNEKYRIEWIHSVLKNIPNNQSILDAGAGELQYKKFCTHLQYTSQDFNQYDGKGDNMAGQMGNWARSTDITSDIVSIPVSDSSFDNILCTEVLEHIPYPDRAIGEFSRILKTGGQLIITAPFCSMTHFSPYYFANGFSEYWYKKILEENNLKITTLVKNGNYFNYLEQESTRLPLMVKRYCSTNLLLFGFVGFFSIMQILLLKYLSTLDKKSNEMLYFGTHIIAIKN